MKHRSFHLQQRPPCFCHLELSFSRSQFKDYMRLRSQGTDRAPTWPATIQPELVPVVGVAKRVFGEACLGQRCLLSRCACAFQRAQAKLDVPSMRGSSQPQRARVPEHQQIIASGHSDNMLPSSRHAAHCLRISPPVVVCDPNSCSHQATGLIGGRDSALCKLATCTIRRAG